MLALNCGRRCAATSMASTICVSVGGDAGAQFLEISCDEATRAEALPGFPLQHRADLEGMRRAREKQQAAPAAKEERRWTARRARAR